MGVGRLAPTQPEWLRPFVRRIVVEAHGSPYDLRKRRGRHDVGAQGLERLRSPLRDAWLDARSPASRSLELVDCELHVRRGGELP